MKIITLHEVGQAAYRSNQTVVEAIRWFQSQGYTIVVSKK